jgi:hypothetical protein
MVASCESMIRGNHNWRAVRYTAARLSERFTTS